MADVFVSYASVDKQYADRVVASLEAVGVPCFCAPRDIAAGLPYGEAIMQGLRACRAFVVIVSEHSLDSAHVINEVERAVHYDLHLIPFRVDQSPLHGSMELFLSSKHWLDATAPPLEAHLSLLGRAVSDALVARAGRSARGEPHGGDLRSVPPPVPASALRPSPQPWRARWWAAGAAWALAVLVTSAAVYRDPPFYSEPDPPVTDSRDTPARESSTAGTTTTPEPLRTNASNIDDGMKAAMTKYLDGIALRLSAAGVRSHEDSFAMLATGTERAVRFEVDANRVYTVVAGCSQACTDVDLVVSDDQGREVGRDMARDDTPQVQFSTNTFGSMTFVLKMATCNSAECLAGVAILSAPGGSR